MLGNTDIRMIVQAHDFFVGELACKAMQAALVVDMNGWMTCQREDILQSGNGGSRLQRDDVSAGDGISHM